MYEQKSREDKKHIGQKHNESGDRGGGGECGRVGSR